MIAHYQLIIREFGEIEEIERTQAAVQRHWHSAKILLPIKMHLLTPSPSTCTVFTLGSNASSS